MNEKLVKHIIRPKKYDSEENIILDDMEDETGMNSVTEEASFSQLGTAPTPSIAFVKNRRNRLKKKAIKEAQTFNTEDAFITSAEATQSGDKYIVKFLHNDFPVARGTMRQNGTWEIAPHLTDEVYDMEDELGDTMVDSWNIFKKSNNFDSLVYNIADRIYAEKNPPYTVVESLNAIIDEATR